MYKKKKGFTWSLPHKNLIVSNPSLLKKKKNLVSKQKRNQFRCVLYYSCLFRIEYSFLASHLCFVFVILSDNFNFVRVSILCYLGVCISQFHRVCFLFSLKVSWYQIWDFRILIVFLNFLIESWFFLKSKVESGF